ncbi:hypothetical protein BD413DRAFT_616949 [Trametes elegans]|nr:hypothetical protein BD413DRAFT_616949 [Trametes elegans]
MSTYGNESNDFDYRTKNYPPPDDTTSEGGYGAPNVFSPQSQRRADPAQSPHSAQSSQGPSMGLIDQSLDGGPLGRELQDAKQGADPRTREQYAHEARRDFASSNPTTGAQGLNPYGRNPDSTREAGERLAASYADQRGRQYESGSAASRENDAGAF